MMKQMLTLCLALVLGSAVAQIKTPAPSPMGKVTQTVGLTEITVEYSRPSAKGRKVFGDLVPFGERWRTGANAATKITFSEDVQVEGAALKAGTYALYTLPNEHEWQVYFYKNANQSGLPRAWDENEVAASFKVKPRQAGDFVETFTIGIGMVASDAAQLQLAWENTIVPISFTVPTDIAVMKSIEKTMAGPSANDYYAAGRYLYESGKDKNKALEYIQKANSMDAKFWTIRMEALVLADLGRKKEAIEAAKKSLDMAKSAGNSDYVRMNEKSIADWSGK